MQASRKHSIFLHFDDSVEPLCLAWAGTIAVQRIKNSISSYAEQPRFVCRTAKSVVAAQFDGSAMEATLIFAISQIREHSEYSNGI